MKRVGESGDLNDALENSEQVTPQPEITLAGGVCVFWMKGTWQPCWKEMKGKTLTLMVTINGAGGRTATGKPALPREIACRG